MVKNDASRGQAVALFARGSLPWLATPLAATVALLLVWLQTGAAWSAWSAAGVMLVELFLAQFFRDPERETAPGVASPADGKVVRMDRITDDELGEVDRLSIFMSPKDVHVNRFPLDGKVVSVRHVAGGHIPAFDKDSHLNERVVTTLDTAVGRVKVIQIAGTVARRIVPYVSGGEAAVKGARFGLIRLGSRCDVLVPPGSIRWTVALKQQVYAGKTQVGEPLGAQAAAPHRATPKREAPR